MQTVAMRKELNHLLRGGQTQDADEAAAGEAACEPLWGRRFEYRGDLEASGLVHRSPSLTGVGPTGGQWTCLRLDQLQDLRACMSCGPDRRRPSSTANGSLEGCGPGGEAREHREFGADERARLAYNATKTLNFFAQLPARRCVALLATADLVDLEEGDYVFRQGDASEFLYVVARGSASVETVMPNLWPEPVVVATLYDGDVFGHGRLRHRTASVRALEELCLLRFPALDIGLQAEAADTGAPESCEGSDSCPSTAGSVEEDEPRTRDATAIQSRTAAREAAELYEVLAALRRSPFLHCSALGLERLVASAQQIELRYGDVLVRVGQRLRRCFLILEGTCTTHVAPSGEQARVVERLHSGRMFGLGVLHGPRECPYPATVSLRAETSQVRLLVLTARSLFYLPDEEVDTLKKMLEETDDPVHVPPERLKAFCEHFRTWKTVKRKVLREERAYCREEKAYELSLR